MAKMMVLDLDCRNTGFDSIPNILTSQCWRIRSRFKLEWNIDERQVFPLGLKAKLQVMSVYSFVLMQFSKKCELMSAEKPLLGSNTRYSDSDWIRA